MCNALRQQNGENLSITSEITVKAHKKGVFVSVYFDNSCKDHRVRAVFDFENSIETHNSSGQFDLVTRRNALSEKWKKDDNSLRTYEFIERTDIVGDGEIIAIRGNNEYEINKNGATEITLVRSVGVLGDWFPFYTNDSQCLRRVESSYMIEFFDAAERSSAIYDAFMFHKPVLVAFNGFGNGATPENLPYLVSGDVFVSCVHQNGKRENVIRLFNPYSESKEIIFSDDVTLISMDEKHKLQSAKSFVVPPKKIFTVKF